MDFVENFKAFLVSVIAFLPMCLKFFLTRSQPLTPSLPSVDVESLRQPTLPSLPASENDPETLQPESPPRSINQFDFESSQSSTPPSTNDPETLQPHTTPLPSSSTFNIELLQPPFPTNQPESSQQQPQSQQLPLSTTPTTPSNLNKLESSVLEAQRHLQWTNSVLSFCFSYAIAVSLLYAQSTDHRQHNQPNSSLDYFFSFLVLLIFNLFFLASFIRPSCTKASEMLEKVAFIVAFVAYCHATAIPFPVELKFAVLAVFLLSLLVVTISYT